MRCTRQARPPRGPALDAPLSMASSPGHGNYPRGRGRPPRPSPAPHDLHDKCTTRHGGGSPRHGETTGPRLGRHDLLSSKGGGKDNVETLDMRDMISRLCTSHSALHLSDTARPLRFWECRACPALAVELTHRGWILRDCSRRRAIPVCPRCMYHEPPVDTSA